MRQMGWKKVAALSEEDHKYADYITAVQDLVEKDGLSFVANRNIPNDAKLPLAQVIRFPPPPHRCQFLEFIIIIELLLSLLWKLRQRQSAILTPKIHHANKAA